jgi:hypothetical protein
MITGGVSGGVPFGALSQRQSWGSELHIAKNKMQLTPMNAELGFSPLVMGSPIVLFWRVGEVEDVSACGMKWVSGQGWC